MKKHAQVADCRAVNQALILKQLERCHCATKQELALATGLSVMSVGTVIEQLAKENRVTMQKRSAVSSGRPAIEYRYNTAYAHVAVLYTCATGGKDTLYLCVADLGGTQVFNSRAVLQNIKPDSFMPYIEQLIEQYPTIRALAFGLPGTQTDGVFVCVDYPALLGVNLAQLYQEKFNMPVTVENDVNAAVRGYCALRKREDGCVGYLYFPEKYPPGLGLFLNGRVFCGAHGFAGEVGALPLGIDWKNLDYHSVSAGSSAVARMAGAVACMLDLDTLVLCGEFLQLAHLDEIRRQCAAYLAGPPPQLELSRGFTADYASGVIASALALLRPSARLIQEDMI